MKAQLIFVFVALLGGAQCFRIRRQAVAAPEAAPAVAAAPAAAPVDVSGVDAAPAAGPAAAEALIAGNVAVAADPAAAPTPDTAGLNVALGFMVDELDKQSALGGPVNPAGLQKACLVALKIKMLGGEVDKPTQDKLDSVAADFAVQAAAPADFSAFAVPGGFF